jgi:Acyl-CoA reductase (LuxC)
MSDFTHIIDSPAQLSAAAERMRQTLMATDLTANTVLDVLANWATALGSPETAEIPGVAFLRLWLRRTTLESIITRELGSRALHAAWIEDGRGRLKAFPIGVVGHWPAGNIEIQPLLSLTCACLGGNASLVRIPSALVNPTRRLMQKLDEADPQRVLAGRVFMAVFDHARLDLQDAMARAVDGAMIWGGKEAVLNVRALPFPHWARLVVFGPRVSVAAVDADTWCDKHERKSWCRRLARDVWQFDQQACSSPQVLFLESRPGISTAEFLQDLKYAFEAESRLHPRQTIHPALTSAICQARASWLLADTANRAIFPATPDWTLLVGRGSAIPKPTQGRTLTVLEVDDLWHPISRFDGNVQALGLAMSNPEQEARLASEAARRGVDRIVKLGRMHLFASPWDGLDLIRPMVRMVRQVPSTE